MNKNNAILRDEIRIPNNGERNGVDKYNILYVDDHNLTLSYFNNSYGDKYNVIVANSPRDGFKILDKQPIDLVISDQDMPEISGIEFLKQISILHPEVGRVLLTKRNDVETLTSAINDANVNRFILKSCSVSTTKKAIDKVLDNIKLKNDNRILQEKLHALISQKNKTLEIQKKIFQLNIELNKKLESSLNIAEGNWQDALSEITEGKSVV